MRFVELDVHDNGYAEVGDYRVGHLDPSHEVAHGGDNPAGLCEPGAPALTEPTTRINDPTRYQNKKGAQTCPISTAKELALGQVDTAEISELEALTALVADFSGDGERLGVVRDGFVGWTLGLVDVAETTEGRALACTVPMCAENLERCLVALPGLGISALLGFNPPQLQQPLRLNQRQLPLFV